MLFRTIYFIFLFTLKYWILKKISVRLRFANLNLKFSSGLNFEIQIKIKKKKFEFISINSKLKKKTYKIHFCLLTRILNNLFSNHRNYIALPNFIRSILRANDNTHRFNLFAMSSRHFSSLYLYIYIYYIEQKRRCYLVLEWNQKRRGKWRLGEQSEFQQEVEENSGVYAGRGCRASTFHFRRQGGSFLFRMEEFVSRSPRAKPGKCKEKRGKMAANRGGKSRKNKSELRSLNIRWKLRFACTQTRKTDSVSSSPLISSQR